MLQLNKEQIIFFVFTLLMCHMIVGVIISVIFMPMNDPTQLIWIISILAILATTSYFLLSKLFSSMETDIPDSIRAFSAALPDRAVVLDVNGRYVDVINRYQHTGVYQPPNIVGKTVSEIYADEFATFVMQTLKEVIQSDKPSVIEYSNVNLIGEMVHYEGRIIPYKDQKTGEHLAIWSSRDISERVEAEKTRLDLAVERNKVQFLRDFVSNMTHDFKTPLAIINTNVHIARKTKSSIEREDRLDRIQDQVKKITRMVDDMLESARLEGDTKVSLVPTDLSILLTQTVLALKPKADKQNIVLSLDVPEIPQSIMVDAMPNELSRALTNLLDNAIKYTDKGGAVDVQLTLKNQHTIITIKDTGIGIEDDEIEHVFDRFHRTHAARFFTSGTGLGLSIVKLIIDRHHGQIEVTSEKDKGSIFTVTLPSIEITDTINSHAASDLSD